MYYDIIAAGYGGQGIIQLGRVLALTGMLAGYEVTCVASYGAEIRGGTANTTVIISSQEIGSPVVTRPQGLMAMNQVSLARFGPKVKAGGLVLVNTSLVQNWDFLRPADYRIIGVAATQIAQELGSLKVANMVVLGAFISQTNLFFPDTVCEAIRRAFTERTPELIELNIRALKQGIEAAHPIQTLLRWTF